MIYIQPVAYSDKGTIYYKVFNLNGSENSKLTDQTNDKLLTTYFTYQNAYYTKLKELLLSNWNLILKTSNLQNGFTELKDLDNFLKS
jgi:hypothetical protein